jgi:hypothetical protein
VLVLLSCDAVRTELHLLTPCERNLLRTLQLTFYALDLQAHGVGYYSINECGKVGAVGDAGLREWVVGSYLMSKGSASGVYISGVQQYGSLLHEWPELLVPIGKPHGPPVIANITTASTATAATSADHAATIAVSVSADGSPTNSSPPPHGNGTSTRVGRMGANNIGGKSHGNGAAGVWSRAFSNGTVLVNANAAANHTVALQMKKGR